MTLATKLRPISVDFGVQQEISILPRHTTDSLTNHPHPNWTHLKSRWCKWHNQCFDWSMLYVMRAMGRAIWMTVSLSGYRFDLISSWNLVCNSFALIRKLWGVQTDRKFSPSDYSYRKTICRLYVYVVWNLTCSIWSMVYHSPHYHWSMEMRWAE